jgi:Ca-activated chloride channel homolog
LLTSVAGRGAAPPTAATQDPFAAYAGGKFEDSLNGFLNIEVERPHDPRVQQDIGSTYYKLGRHDEAEKAFTRAMPNADKKRQAELLYDLGNNAFRQGRLDEAVQRYLKSLELDSKDLDAKYNLEFVRQEIERRQKQQQEQSKQQDKQQDQQKDKPQDQASQKPDKKEQTKQQEPPESAKPQASQKRDGQQSAAAEPKDEKGNLDRDAAERLLQNLNEERPQDKRHGRTRQPEKDW